MHIQPHDLHPLVQGHHVTQSSSKKDTLLSSFFCVCQCYFTLRIVSISFTE